MSEHGPKFPVDDKDEPKTRPDLFDDLYPGRFLKAPLLRGKLATVLITDVYRQKLRGEKGKAPKTVVTFERKTDGPCELVLAKINGTCLRAMFGEPPNWVGKRVTLFATAEWMPKNKGEACVRVRGSPDIDREIPVTFSPPGRKPTQMVMQITGKPAATQPAPARDEERDHDQREPGEDDGRG